MITADEALELVLARVAGAGVVELPVEAAVGHVLAEDVVAAEDVPPFDRAMMDGFAVAIGDAGRTVRVAGQVAAGHESGQGVAPGAAVEIMTGAPCPPGTNAVVPVEDVRREGDSVALPTLVASGQHVQRRGSIRAAGAVTAAAGEPLTTLVLANLAAFGRATVRVARRPSVAVITTGDELVAPGAERRGGAIRDSNGPMLRAMARASHAGSVATRHAADDEAALAEALAASAAADVVVLTGGVSAGRYDLVPGAAQAAGFEPVFHKVAQKPGKPLFFAVAGRRLLFGLPGNPRSSHFCFHRYVAAALRVGSGREPRGPTGVGALAAPLAVTSKRESWIPLHATVDEGGSVRLEPFAEHGSADIFSTTRANAYARFEPGRHDLATGSRLAFEWTCDAFI
jgi:molybdopterin molybdotransferase